MFCLTYYPFVQLLILLTLRPTWFNSFELQNSTVNFQKIISRFPEVSVHVEVLMIWSDLASVIFQYSFDRLA